MKKRVLTALLAVIMVISLGTVSALAKGSTTLPDAENGVITLTEDVNLAATYVVSSDTTIDLNGFTLSSSAIKTLIQVENDAKLIVIDSSNKTGKIVFSVPPFTFGANMLNIAKGSIELNNISVEVNSSSTVANVADSSSLKIEGGSVISQGYNLINGSGSVSLDSTSISLSSIGNVLSKAYLSDSNVLVKTGASTVVTTTTVPTEYNVKYGDWYYDQYGTISDMSITNYEKFADNDGNINITVNEKGSGSFSNGTLSSGSVNLVLNDGATINYKVVNSNVQSIKLATGATITVSGTGSLDVGVIEPSGTLILKTTENENGSTTYSAEEPKDCFTIGTTNYDTLEDALEVANPGDIIVMNKDYTASRSITIGANDKITFDLGGNTLYMNGVNDVIDGTSSRSTTIFNQGNLTIRNGNLSITSAVKKAINGIVNAEGAVLTVEPTANLYSRGNIYEGSYVIVNLGGTVNTAGTINGNGNNGIVTYGGVLNITGGSVKGTGSSMSAAIDIFSRNYDSTSAGAEVSISGGDIYGATYALSTNNVKSSNSSLTITGGSISSQLTTIYWPSAGTLTIGTEGSQTGPTISSAEGSAIEIASGTLNVYGGTLQGGTAMTAADQTKVDAELVNEFRTHSGASNAGDAITVAANRAGSGQGRAVDLGVEVGDLLPHAGRAEENGLRELGTGFEHLDDKLFNHVDRDVGIAGRNRRAGRAQFEHAARLGGRRIVGGVLVRAVEERVLKVLGELLQLGRTLEGHFVGLLNADAGRKALGVGGKAARVRKAVVRNTKGVLEDLRRVGVLGSDNRRDFGRRHRRRFGNGGLFRRFGAVENRGRKFLVGRDSTVAETADHAQERRLLTRGFKEKPLIVRRSTGG